jgi:hypothetical protein
MACHIEIGAGFDQSNGGSQKLTWYADSSHVDSTATQIGS